MKNCFPPRVQIPLAALGPSLSYSIYDNILCLMVRLNRSWSVQIRALTPAQSCDCVKLPAQSDVIKLAADQTAPQEVAAQGHTLTRCATDGAAYRSGFKSIDFTSGAPY
ncbi:hypothetical protein PoB_006134400 [Plakobranchus ocellatus]|uniref:Uncharacterized protein n=1 Tax=Plakobranchus ocellatus TaxID=259542 RepID=A0AAV4CSK1_9GAST|nr:hypothetical protein PoB_006134400 [Plakobranchus ocellatus]